MCAIAVRPNKSFERPPDGPVMPLAGQPARQSLGAAQLRRQSAREAVAIATLRSHTSVCSPGTRQGDALSFESTALTSRTLRRSFAASRLRSRMIANPTGIAIPYPGSVGGSGGVSDAY